VPKVVSGGGESIRGPARLPSLVAEGLRATDRIAEFLGQHVPTPANATIDIERPFGMMHV
jgi:hypothetical protein